MWIHIFLVGSLPRRCPPEFTAILMIEFWREATAAFVLCLLCQSGRRRPENVSILSSLVVTLRLFSRQLFAISLALRANAVLLWLGYFFGPIHLLLISTDLPHKLSSLSGGFVILCYFHSTELHNDTILVTMTISIQLSL